MLNRTCSKKISIHIKHRVDRIVKFYCSKPVLKPPWRVMFFGSDEFSINSLKCLYNEYRSGTILNKLEVVTALKRRANPIQQYALEQKLPLHNWPVEVQKNTFDIGVVVSFGNLIPERIIQSFPLGMINVHASLLPRWRGAAPIMYAILSGDKVTGVSVMRIKPRHFDIGEIIAQKEVKISDNITMPELKDELSIVGAETLVEVFQDLTGNLEKSKLQSEDGITLAPRIQWKLGALDFKIMSSTQVYNLYRALTDFIPLQSQWQGTPVKLYNCRLVSCTDNSPVSSSPIVIPGYALYCKMSQQICIQCADGKWVGFTYIGVSGKKPMNSRDFFNGFMSKYHPKCHRFK